ncbi:MAG: hypothetical protein WB586_30440 [Chthoniobacterales bacterium]
MKIIYYTFGTAAAAFFNASLPTGAEWAELVRQASGLSGLSRWR